MTDPAPPFNKWMEMAIFIVGIVFMVSGAKQIHPGLAWLVIGALCFLLVGRR